jgi:hypothetical protein
MPDLPPCQVCQEILLVDQISAITDVLMQDVTPDPPREPVGKMQLEVLTPRDNLKDQGDWLV